MRVRRQGTDWDLHTHNTHTFDNNLYPECIRNSYESIIRQTTQWKNGPKKCGGSL